MKTSTLFRLSRLRSFIAPAAPLLALAFSHGASAQAAAPAADAWQITGGAGVVSRPLYAGSAQRKVSGFPVFSAQHGRYFIGSMPGTGVPAGAGAYLVQDEHWQLGVGVGGDFDKPRKESDSASLRGLGDIEATAFGVAFASYNQRWYSVRGSLLTDIGGKGQGTRAMFELEGRYAITDSLMLTAGPSVTWADSRYTQTHFGIDATQSANAGRAAYAAKGGVNAVGLGAGLRWQPAPAWTTGVMLNASRLRGAAAASPLVERKAQTTYGLFAAYRF